ncbi:DUF3179 domain-containing (seleno)protein [Roseiconus lacunae]|uniref:DUF3179 domain-containing (Seleno)protein n=1 Tax=Roseiconus lacunae TaxID=2605694 RepID=A0ABT7PJZ2_9BACT|nr:DUF3179 domain-containing (seleno)protein [Roseiconus lacunae]MCD0462933.1 DUF3179 domain-containing protein [Roseiconus lacunae]MDM4016501.1 DUF3179 domain-containing (seleno)protein [Roseiconus lacunae]
MISHLIMIGIVVVAAPLAWLAYQANTYKPDRQLSLRPPTAEELAKERALQEELDKKWNANENHPKLRALASFKGHRDPVLRDSSDVQLDDAAEVIGVEMDGVQCAVVMAPMVDPKNHIVNLVLAGKPVTVTYCDLANCVRVVTDNRSDSVPSDSIPLNVGGLDVFNRMVVELDGELYAQSSENLPLADYPYERTTWGSWRKDNAETKVWIP